MKKLNIQGFCGFSIDPFIFSSEWSEKEVYCSFDKAGKYKIPTKWRNLFP